MKINEFSFILKPSTVSGVGVFATHDISKGTPLFINLSFKKRKVEDVPEEFHRFCIFINDYECYSPNRFDHMEIGWWYANHSNDSNIGYSKDDKNTVIALKDIKKDEEIFLNYNELEEPQYLKEFYYK